VRREREAQQEATGNKPDRFIPNNLKLTQAAVAKKECFTIAGCNELAQAPGDASRRNARDQTATTSASGKSN
jgi:hypothetical protein